MASYKGFPGLTHTHTVGTTTLWEPCRPRPMLQKVAYVHPSHHRHPRCSPPVSPPIEPRVLGAGSKSPPGDRCLKTVKALGTWGGTQVPLPKAGCWRSWMPIMGEGTGERGA